MKERFCELNELFDDMISAKTKVIPIISDVDEDILLDENEIPNEMPILALRGNVLFPGVILPVTAGRKKSIKLLKEASADSSVLTLKSYEALSKLAEGNATKIIIPSNMEGIATFGTVLNEMMEKKDSKK